MQAGSKKRRRRMTRLPFRVLIDVLALRESLHEVVDLRLVDTVMFLPALPWMVWVLVMRVR